VLPTGATTATAERGDRGLGGGGIHVVHDNRRAVPGELARVGEAEALPATGDDGDFASE
jgi:hypothetical protein